MSAYSGFTIEETTDRVSRELCLQSELTHQPLSTSLSQTHLYRYRDGHF